MCSLLVSDTLHCCANSSAYTVNAGAPAIQTTFQATVKAKGFLPVESALVRILLCRSSQHFCLQNLASWTYVAVTERLGNDIFIPNGIMPPWRNWL